GGRWPGRARGCSRHSPGARPQGQVSAYQSTRGSASRRRSRATSSRSISAQIRSIRCERLELLPDRVELLKFDPHTDSLKVELVSREEDLDGVDRLAVSRLSVVDHLEESR